MEFNYPVDVNPVQWDREIAGLAAQHSLFVLIRRRFRELERSEGLTQAALAERMGRTRAQISRWMSSPGNMTIASAGELLMAMGRKLEFRLSDW